MKMYIRFSIRNFIRTIFEVNGFLKIDSFEEYFLFPERMVNLSGY